MTWLAPRGTSRKQPCSHDERRRSLGCGTRRQRRLHRRRLHDRPPDGSGDAPAAGYRMVERGLDTAALCAVAHERFAVIVMDAPPAEPRRLRDGQADPRADRLGADADHLPHRVRARRARDGDGVRQRRGRLRLHAGPRRRAAGQGLDLRQARWGVTHELEEGVAGTGPGGAGRHGRRVVTVTGAGRIESLNGSSLRLLAIARRNPGHLRPRRFESRYVRRDGGVIERASPTRAARRASRKSQADRARRGAARRRHDRDPRRGARQARQAHRGRVRAEWRRTPRSARPMLSGSAYPARHHWPRDRSSRTTRSGTAAATSRPEPRRRDPDHRTASSPSADIYDALTHVRPDKPAWKVARRDRRAAAPVGRELDPQVVDAFFSSQREPSAALAGTFGRSPCRSPICPLRGLAAP